jgi:hypothetical protein
MDSQADNLRLRAQRAAQSGQLIEAELLYRQLISTLEYLFGEEHLDIAVSSHELARLLEEQGKIQEALKWREKTSELLLKLDDKR